MRRHFNLFLFLNILLFVSGLNAETPQPEPLPYYFEQNDWTKIIQSGETTLVANSKNLKVRVNIKTHTVDIGKFDPNGAFVKHADNQSCSYTRYPCSVVNNIEIIVNGKQLLFPTSIFCDLADLNEGKVFIEKKKMVLMLEGGDASTGYIIKLEFDQDHIRRKMVYADPSLSRDVLLEEVTYHHLGETH